MTAVAPIDLDEHGRVLRVREVRRVRRCARCGQLCVDRYRFGLLLVCGWCRGVGPGDWPTGKVGVLPPHWRNR